MNCAVDVEPIPSPTAELWSVAAAAVREAIDTDASILLVCHVNPDGDALGSMLGFAHGLRRLGASRLVCTFPGPLTVPTPLRMPGVDSLASEDEVGPAPDLLVTFDAASIGRLGRFAGHLEAARLSIVLDHHASNSGFGTIPLVDASAAATAVVTARLLDELGVEYDAEIAECLYVALATDTGSFKFDLTTPHVHQLAARLVATGLDVADISRRIFDTRPFGAMKLLGDVLQRAELDESVAGGLGLVTAVATLDDLTRYAQPPYILEALIDSIRCAAEADIACLLKQVGQEEWSVSLRSKGGADVGRLAVAMGGGGHRLAAGFTAYGSADQVLASVRARLEQTR